MRNKLKKILCDTGYCGPVNIAPPSETSTKAREDSEMRDRWYRAEDALRTLVRADEIRADKALMADVKVVAAHKQRETQAAVKR